MFTFNQSSNSIVDEDYDQVNDIDTTYNFNVKKNEWEQGKSNWETVELNCLAFGGRPEPEIIWYIENNDNDNLNEQHVDSNR